MKSNHGAGNLPREIGGLDQRPYAISPMTNGAEEGMENGEWQRKRRIPTEVGWKRMHFGF